MPTFDYRALNPEGRYITGRIEAPNATQARRKLRADLINVVEIKDRAEANGGPRFSLTAVKKRKSKSVNLESLQISRIKADKLSFAFLDKLYQLVSSGLPLGDAIKSLTQRLNEPVLKAICEGLWRDLCEGSSLAAAMRRQPNIFDATLASMIEAGEATGNLKPILENVIELLEARLRLRKEIISGLSYPAFILTIVFFVLLFVLFYLMPRVETMLDSMGGELTLSARLVVGLGEFSITTGPFILIGLLIAGVSVFQWRRTDDGRLATDRFLLRVPVLREVVMNAELSRLANLAGILLGSGVDATDALKLIERSMKNHELLSRFRASRALIRDGASFSQAFHHEGLLPDMDLDILSISENTGNLVTGFTSIYRNRHTALGEQMKKMTVVISTGALFVVFGIVSLVVFGIVSSIMQLSQNVLGG